MKTFIKIFFYLSFLLSTFQSFGQNNLKQINLEEEVIGIKVDDENVILITENNYLKFKTIGNDNFEEYYKKVYHDSTLVNPNTELKEDFDLSIFPLISPNINGKNQFTFDTPIQLGLLINFNNSKDLILTNYGFEFLNSLKNKIKNDKVNSNFTN